MQVPDPMRGIRAFTGHMIPFFDFTYKHIDVRDTAHALSQICRFNGHTREFYSVAQHSVLVMEHLARKGWAPFGSAMLAALMHDATETVLGDMTKPLKLIMPEYVKLEKQIEAVYEGHYNCSFNHPSIKEADVFLRKVEQRDLMNGSEGPFPTFDEHPLIVPLPCKEAEVLFLSAFTKVSGLKP